VTVLPAADTTTGSVAACRPMIDWLLALIVLTRQKCFEPSLWHNVSAVQFYSRDYLEPCQPSGCIDVNMQDFVSNLSECENIW
jgi:hypothetical protein